MAKKSLLGAAALGLGLIFGGHLYAQNAQDSPTKTEQNSFEPALYDLNLVSPSNPVTEIDRSKGYDFYRAIKRAPDEFPTKDYAVSGKAGLEEIIGYLESPKGKKLYQDDSSRLFEINAYKSILDSIASEDESSQNYNDSLKNFSSDVKLGDGKVTPSQLSKIDEGHYALVEEGVKGKNGHYSYVVPVYIGPKKGIDEKAKELGYMPVVTKKGKEGIDLILQLNTNPSLDSYGLTLVQRFHPFRNKAIGLGLVESVGLSLDQPIGSPVNTQSYDPILGNISMQGSKVATNQFNLGIGAEISYSFPEFTLFADEEIEYLSGIDESSESISINGQVANSNILSVPYSSIASKTSVGGEVPVSANVSIGALASYDTAKGFGFGPRVSLHLGK